jgi:AAA15 family ATPase/GTPase
MFTRIQALRFRCLRSVDQELGRFMTLVGPNASGKTTFLDVIALLGDLMRNGGKVADTVLERSPDFEKLLWMGQGSSFQLAVEANLPDAIREKMSDDLQHYTKVRYEVEIGMDREENLIVLNHEALWLLNGMDRPAPRHPELFPSSSEPPETLFMKKGAKNRKLIVSNQPNGNANYYADGRKTYNPSFRLGRETSALANIPADRDSFHAAPRF